MEEKGRGSFSSQIGFILAAAGSAIGLGNLWRFPYLAAKDGGGLFLVVYLVLVLTFGFTMLISEITIGRKTQQGPLTAYGALNKHWGFIGIFAWLVPIFILPYYCVIGGWVFKYLTVYLTGQGATAATDSFFSGFITGTWQPMVFMLVYLLLTAVVVFFGVDKGIERLSKVLMPVLLIMILGISVYSLTLSHVTVDGEVRTGLQGLKIYAIPSLEGLTFSDFLHVIMDAMGQLFFSISVAMGIMIAYGSYVPKGTNMIKSINQIEFFDTLVAFLSGLMIVPAIYVFSGVDGMSAGPSLMFVALPKVFEAMGSFGGMIGLIFFFIVAVAALTSSVSIMEAIVSSVIDKFGFGRKKATLIVTGYALLVAILVNLGYNVLYFEVHLPNMAAGATGQILDVLDYISNNILMPIVAILTCILVGWVVKPQTIIDEASNYGELKFGRRRLYIVTVKFIAPVLLTVLLLQAFGLF